MKKIKDKFKICKEFSPKVIGKNNNHIYTKGETSIWIEHIRFWYGMYMPERMLWIMLTYIVENTKYRTSSMNSLQFFIDNPINKLPRGRWK
jgi:hypothetical protein